MNLQHSAGIAAPKAKVWAFLMDVPAVSECVPGLQQVRPVDGKTYEGTLKIRVGPIALALAGSIEIERQDQSAGQATMSAQAKDAKVGGGLTARMEMLLSERSER
ncbi:MAG: hypothetical protein KGJ86_14945, partial [Chloroflexota bacterium]|nr:hypothetical protein [Chloroflexota bacterium]